MTGPKRLNLPEPARVRAGPGGRPLAVDGRAVEAVRESWLIEDRWWTDTPLRRRYWEVVTVDGRNLVVFRELGGFAEHDPGGPSGPDGTRSEGSGRGAAGGSWYRQR